MWDLHVNVLRNGNVILKVEVNSDLCVRVYIIISNYLTLENIMKILARTKQNLIYLSLFYDNL